MPEVSAPTVDRLSANTVPEPLGCERILYASLGIRVSLLHGGIIRGMDWTKVEATHSRWRKVGDEWRWGTNRHHH